MKGNCLNHSSQKTRNLIRTEFARLIKEKKELSKVTVTELVHNIDINRGTFYFHYDCIDDVAKEIENEALDLLNREINSLSDVESLIDKLTLFLKENTELYFALFKSDDPIIFMNRLEKIATNKLTELLKNTHDNDLELNICIFVSGIIKLYIKYFRGEIHSSLEEINLYLKNLFKMIFISNS